MNTQHDQQKMISRNIRLLWSNMNSYWMDSPLHIALGLISENPGGKPLQLVKIFVQINNGQLPVITNMLL